MEKTLSYFNTIVLYKLYSAHNYELLANNNFEEFFQYCQVYLCSWNKVILDSSAKVILTLLHLHMATTYWTLYHINWSKNILQHIIIFDCKNSTTLQTKFGSYTKFRFDIGEFTRILWLPGSQCFRFDIIMRIDWVPISFFTCTYSKKNVGRCRTKSLTEIKHHPTQSNIAHHTLTWCSNEDNVLCPTMLDDVVPKCCICLNGL